MFATYGPFEFRTEENHVNLDSLSEFWEDTDEKVPGISFAGGIYIFTVNDGDGLAPYYVGKTGKTFQSRFKEHLGAKTKSIFSKLLKPIIAKQVSVFLLPRITPKGKFIKGASKGTKAYRELEFMLIARCLEKNPELINKQETKFHRKLKLPGFLGDDPKTRNESAKKLASLLKKK